MGDICPPSMRALRCHMSKPAFGFKLASALPLPADEVWARVSTMEGVNAELMPWVRMTLPRRQRGRSLMEGPIGERMFSSWLLLGSVLPIDRHHLRMDVVEDGHFLESSRSWLQSAWHHERFVSPTETGCQVIDELAFRPRIPLLGHVLLPIIRGVFRHRHRRLVKWAQARRASG